MGSHDMLVCVCCLSIFFQLALFFLCFPAQGKGEPFIRQVLEGTL